MQRLAERQLRWLASNLPVPVVRLLRYRKEFLFDKGFVSYRGPDPSIAFFTVKKCASTLMRRMLAEINRRHLHLVHLNLAGYLWDTGSEPTYQYLKRHATRLLRDDGILYGPLRNYVDLSHLTRTRVLLMLRDPRDVIVSGYFSARFSHRPSAQKSKRQDLERQREELASIAIDDYALGFADRLAPVYAEYRAHIARNRVLTYEDMWHDFDTWARQLGQLLHVDFDAADIIAFRRMADIDAAPGVEDVKAHRRKGKPGDYLDKLSKPVAARITDQFADTLKWLYP